MSDFLTNLIQRTLTPPANLRPRLVSRFETPAGSEMASQLEIEQTGETAPSSTGEISPLPKHNENAAPTQPQRREERREDTAAEHLSGLRASAVEPTSQESAQATQVPLSTAAREPRQERRDPALREESGSRGIGVPRSSAPQASAAKPAAEFKTTVGANASLSVPPPTTSRSEATAQAAFEAVPSSHAHAVPPVPKPLKIHPRKASPLNPHQASVAHSPSSPPPPPDIHVTIGRVEVRAVVPPTPTPSAAKPAPMLSLEEYLQKGARR